MFAAAFAVISLVLSVAAGHPQPGVRSLGEEACMTLPPFQSYHIHTLFWQNNANSTKAAEKLQADFMTAFGLTYEANSCKYSPGDLRETEMCVFGVSEYLLDVLKTQKFRAITNLCLYVF